MFPHSILTLNHAAVCQLFVVKNTGVNFISILQAAFMRADPKTAKSYCQLDSLFCALRICAQQKLQYTVWK
jgi:hypothetical protein